MLVYKGSFTLDLLNYLKGKLRISETGNIQTLDWNMKSLHETCILKRKPVAGRTDGKWSKGKNLLLLFSQLCLTPYDPLDWSTTGLPVLHHLPELAQTHIHRVDNAIQPSHPLSSSSLPAFSHSQHQGLFWISQLFISGGQSIE